MPPALLVHPEKGRLTTSWLLVGCVAPRWVTCPSAFTLPACWFSSDQYPALPWKGFFFFLDYSGMFLDEPRQGLGDLLVLGVLWLFSLYTGQFPWGSMQFCSITNGRGLAFGPISPSASRRQCPPWSWSWTADSSSCHLQDSVPAAASLLVTPVLPASCPGDSFKTVYRKQLKWI